MVFRQPATRLEPKKLVFRPDTDDLKLYWLEIHFGTYADPGECYLFTINERQYTGFVVRPLDQEMKTCKWALLFTNPTEGRKLMKLIAAVYDLSPDLLFDQS